MFIGRESEISVLENTYNKDGFQMTVIYGRRRIGKSYLITEFMKGKKSSYYVASQSSMEDNVRKWSVQLVSDLVPEMEGVAFDDLEAFSALSEIWHKVKDWYWPLTRSHTWRRLMILFYRGSKWQ